MSAQHWPLVSALLVSSTKCARLGAPVTGSCSARCLSRAALRRCSRTAQPTASATIAKRRSDSWVSALSTLPPSSSLAATVVAAVTTNSEPTVTSKLRLSATQTSGTTESTSAEPRPSPTASMRKGVPMTTTAWASVSRLTNSRLIMSGTRCRHHAPITSAAGVMLTTPMASPIAHVLTESAKPSQPPPSAQKRMAVPASPTSTGAAITPTPTSHARSVPRRRSRRMPTTLTRNHAAPPYPTVIAVVPSRICAAEKLSCTW